MTMPCSNRNPSQPLSEQVHDFGFFRYNPNALQFLEYEEIPLAPEAASVGLDIRVVGNDSGEKVNAISLQPCFPKRARLNNRKFWKPIPPSPFGLDIFPREPMHRPLFQVPAPPKLGHH
jgi:hypothetical protein